MKKMLIISFLIISSILISSCTAHNYKETYFVHAVGFEKSDDEYKIHAVCEKLEDQEKNYFVVTKSGNTINQATKELIREYSDCYFATAEIYIIPNENKQSLIPHLAKEICDSNVYPSKSFIISTDENIKYFLSRVKSEEDLKKIGKLTRNNKTNAIKYFSLFLAEKTIEIPSLEFNKSGTMAITKDNKHKINDKESKNEKDI